MIREGAISFNAEGAFYNPKMVLNRDVGVAVARALNITQYLDALAASGARGLRIAKETDVEKVILNDVSPRACSLIEENIELNSLSNCEICCSNANVLMHQRRFEAVDLDPFGSPAPFLAAASRSAGSYLFITATDTAPLCGAHLKSGIRKYQAVPVKTDYHREMGARILLGTVARELAKIDKAVYPLLAHVTDHYVRLYLEVKKGARLADRTLEMMGYLEHCHECRSWRTIPGMQCRSQGSCDLCGRKTVTAGPLWLGPIQNCDLIGRAIEELEDVEGRSDRALRLLQSCGEEIDEPMYYDHHRLCKDLKTTPGRIDDLIEDLRAMGWEASRTHFSGVGVKTNASLGSIQEILSGAELSGIKRHRVI